MMLRWRRASREAASCAPRNGWICVRPRFVASQVESAAVSWIAIRPIPERPLARVTEGRSIDTGENATCDRRLIEFGEREAALSGKVIGGQRLEAERFFWPVVAAYPKVNLRGLAEDRLLPPRRPEGGKAQARAALLEAQPCRPASLLRAGLPGPASLPEHPATEGSSWDRSR